MHTRLHTKRVGISLLAFILLLALPLVPAFAGGEAEVDDVDAEAWDEPEAPALAALVEAGELPPLEERLPDNPMVIEPYDSVGRYGGEMVVPMVAAPDSGAIVRTVFYEPPVRIDLDWSGEYIPNTLADFEVSDDAKEYTFYMREGMRWSDGEPYTADDIVFWFEDVAMNEELSPAPPGAITDPEGEPGRVEKVDEYTVRWIFENPNALLLEDLAGPHGSEPWRYPKHYMSQFHIDHNPDAEEEAQDEGYDTWMDWFDSMGVGHTEQLLNPDLPVYYSHVVTEPMDGDATIGRLERNPYYFKVDSEGNQLPYIDEWRVDLFEDDEVVLLRTLAGEIDYIYRYIHSVENRPVLYDGQQDGDYWLQETVSSDAAEEMVMLNLSHQDEVMREIFNNKDFRIGLSHALDREEISELVYAGVPEPTQPGPPPESDFHHEQLRTQYIEFDVDLANEYLDRAGYDEVDGEGYRLGPDGERIFFEFMISGDSPARIDLAEIIQTQWDRVGIDVGIDVVSDELRDERFQSNLHDAMIWSAEGGLNPISDPRPYIPYHGYRSMWSIGWLAYLDPGAAPDAEPIEPPEEIKEAYALYYQLLGSPIDEHTDRMLEILDIVADFFPVMGTVEPVPGYNTVSNRVQNVPASMPWGWHPYAAPGPAAPEQFWIDE